MDTGTTWESSEAPGAGGNRRRVAELYVKYGPTVYRRCHQLLRSRDAAQDATQEVFLRLVSNMAKLESRENLLPWMYQVATHHCLNLMRGALHRAGSPADAEELSTRPLDHGDRQLARVLLSRVDVATQAIAVAILVDGMEYSEVSRALGVSRRTIARKLERFLQHARTYAAIDAVNVELSSDDVGAPPPAPDQLDARRRCSRADEVEPDPGTRSRVA